MPRPRDPNAKVQLSIRIDPKLKEELLLAAENREISASELVGRAVSEYLQPDQRV